MTTRQALLNVIPVAAGISAVVLVLTAAEPAAGTASTPQSPAAIAVRVDTQRVIRRMAGGIGANWHALGPATTPIRQIARGSAWGGNPPLENEAAWEQVRQLARWLGMDWVRVEFDQRMYEPERGVFDWDNPEMQTLYRILDWTEANRADVFLTQMWADVEWNTIPGLVMKARGTETIASAPKSLEDFAEGLATLVDHLINKKGYTSIRWLCIVNEPGNKWWRGGPSLLDGLKAVRKALDAKGLTLPLSGPDRTEMEEKGVGLRLFTNDGSSNDEFASFGGAYDMHSYYAKGEARRVALEKWAQWSHARNMPFFLSEFGDFSFLGGPRGDGPRSYAAALSNAETVLQGLSVGVDGFNRWSYLNRGDLDGQWQLVRTWDIEKRAYRDRVEPEPVPFMGYAMLTRFSSKHSDILDTRVTGSRGARQLASTLRSPAGNTTIFLLNLDNTEREVRLTLDGLRTPLTLHPYAVSEPLLTSPGFTLTPGTPVTVSPQSYVVVKLAPLSLTTLTTFRLLPADPGITEDVRRQP